MTDASKVLDDAKYSGTKEVDESLQIDAAKLQPWIDAYIPNAGKITQLNSSKAVNQIRHIKLLQIKKILFSEENHLGNFFHLLML